MSVPAGSSPAGSATPSTTAYSNSHLGNGSAAVNGNGNEHSPAHEDETPKAGPSSIDPTYHALSLSSYIFNIGYLSQQWTDVQLTFFDQAVKLHRVVLSRSPFLARLMQNYQPGASIALSLPDENVTAESIHIALQHFYNPAQHLVKPENARAVLATAFIFEGIPELVHHAYTISRDSITQESVLDYVNWLEATPAPNQRPAGTMFGSVNVQDGRATISGGSNSDIWKEDGHGRYGEWSARLKHDVVDYLIRTMPASLMETSQSLSTDPTLLSIYTGLPFELFKHCVESPQFPIPSTQARFAFAKKVIAQRKKRVATTGMEEIVVLAVGSSQGDVHVTRKPKRTRAPLYKVEG